MRRQELNNRGRLRGRLLLTAVGLFVLVLAALIPYELQQHTINNLQGQTSAQRAQLGSQQSVIASLQAQLANLQAKQTVPPAAAAPAPSPAAAGTTYVSAKGVSITLYRPDSNATVSSPLAVIGEVPGSWSFEASFPVQLLDGSGHLLARTSGHLLGNWMTGQPVPFSAQLTYTAKPSGDGSLVLLKDNPSGLAANDDSVTIPVRF